MEQNDLLQEPRKVYYSFSSNAGFTPDEEEQKELDEMARKREGIFHGTKEIMDEDLKKTLFIIEDIETGVINEIDPLYVQFKK